ncbi:TonB-dependent copper receptor [Aeromonas veronii]|uniref:TonB-dependent copper receptor n=1 Tax=Aeromonas veronii TaxID=654 RepID=UPI0013E04E79|nr:TonB-dependent copper receptor [Aeromonas veronii]MBL0640603.1 TonB-dependent copper receptor [Aeromonas veronii]QIF46234.1 TonB-dependent copper receptor [Aeromonas veronii]
MACHMRTPLALLVGGLACHGATGQGSVQQLDPMVVVATRPASTLEVTLDPKKPGSPMPAADGAGYLKNVTGMSMVRKGGLGGDPVLRGMGMSRLNVQMDGGMLAGGCGGRMDPPTAYVFPQSFDRIRVLKGPQSLEQGATLAGTVLFERDRPEFTAPGLKADASALYGSFGRDDQMVDMTAGSTDGYLRGQFTHSDSDDYRDGHGNKVRSFYRRENGTAQLGWTPGEHTWLELTAERSNARAAYADRTMDGPMFDRESFGLKLKQEQITTHWQRSELTLWDNYIDHIMDNFSLRQNSDPKSLSNPDRRNTGGRWANDIALPADWLLTAGFDSNRDQHRFRKDLDYADKPRQRTLRFEQQGGFAELGRQQGAHSYKGGYRQDRVETTRYGAGDQTLYSETEHLDSGFGRYEYQWSPRWSSYLAWGQAERAPDYWERSKDSTPFTLNQERSRQWDAGLALRSRELDLTLSLFSADIKDYLLYNSSTRKVRNIDAQTRGGELEGRWQFAEQWRLDGGLALVYGENQSDNKPLAQMPPLDGKLALGWQPGEALSFTLLGRAVAAQDRVDVGSGTVAGQDQGETSGFFTMNLSGAWQFAKGWQLSAGVDNLFDTFYYEHLSKSVHSSQAGLGYEQSGRIPEPGRSYWLSVNYRFASAGAI